MEPNNKPNTGENQPNSTERSPSDYFGHTTQDEKEALKYLSADTPEGLSRALNEQMGGGAAPIRPRPDDM